MKKANVIDAAVRYETVRLWLVTDDTGSMDSSLRVLFDEDAMQFHARDSSRGTVHFLHHTNGTFDQVITRILDAEPGRAEHTKGIRIYIATAYRWGDLANEHHLIHVGVDRNLAVSIADDYACKRGGKYGVQVVEYSGLSDEHGPLSSPIHYARSDCCDQGKPVNAWLAEVQRVFAEEVTCRLLMGQEPEEFLQEALAEARRSADVQIGPEGWPPVQRP